jgi:hypothetical protein
MVVSARLVALTKFDYGVLGRITGGKAGESIPIAPGGGLIHPPLKTILNSALVMSAVMRALLMPPPHGASVVGG